MKKILIEYMKEFADFPEEKYQEIANDIDVKSYKKGTVLIKQGEIVTMCYFVLKGLVRQYAISEDGKETTSNFFSEKQAVAVFSSNEVSESKYTMVCMEDCILVLGNLSEEDEMFEKHEGIESMVRKMVEHDMATTRDEFSSFVASTPEERYKNLLESRPELISRVPKNLLASYLGITPESYSRIKKRLEQTYLKLVD